MSMNLGIDAVYYLLFVFELNFPCIFLHMFEYICLDIYDILHRFICTGNGRSALE